MTRRLLAVHAHPDDESSKGAGTYARYAAEGARVVVVSCTGGERGDVQNEALADRAMAERDMAGLRRIEMARARSIMGIEHRWLGYEDSGLPEDPAEALPPHCFARIPLEISAEPLVRIIREVRPQVMVTYDENGGYPHPDHVRAHEIAMYARAAAADPARYPEQGPAWTIDRVYYDRIFNADRMDAVWQRMVATDHPRAAEMGEMRQWMSERPGRPATPPATTHIDVSDFLEVRDAALRAHTSQVAPDSPFFFWPNEVQREAWPTEDFQLVDAPLAASPHDIAVHSGGPPETDLFAGLKADAP